MLQPVWVMPAPPATSAKIESVFQLAVTKEICKYVQLFNHRFLAVKAGWKTVFVIILMLPRKRRGTATKRVEFANKTIALQPIFLKMTIVISFV